MSGLVSSPESGPVSIDGWAGGRDATRRRLTPRQAATVARLTDALLAELAAVGYDDVTVRSVARRAGVAPATAYTYFTSKAHLVAEVFWRRLRALPDAAVDPGAPAHERVAAALRALADHVAAEPALAAASTPALLGPDPDVHHLRDRIGAEIHRRVAAALAGAPGEATDSAPAGGTDVADIADAVDLMLAGALLRAGMGHMPYDALGDRLAALSRLVIGDRP
jgi:AcrR family transcriptional regulator